MNICKKKTRKKNKKKQRNLSGDIMPFYPLYFVRMLISD